MPANNLKDSVSRTREYYDGPADEIYRTVWGDNLHLGVPPRPDATHSEAMEHTNKLMADMTDLAPSHHVIDLGCGYGSTARYLAGNYGCRVTGINISSKELELARQRATESGLAELLKFEYGDFHELSYQDDSFDVVWSQEAFLHAVDRKEILSECQRVLVPSGTLIFSDILVRHDISADDRARIYDRVKSTDMWDSDDYEEAIVGLGFKELQIVNWSQYVAPSYEWVRDRLEESRDSLESRIGHDTIANTIDALTFWIDSANSEKIGWALFVAQQPS